jgi:hypothetical protein
VRDGQSATVAGSLINGQGLLDDDEGEDELDGEDVELQATLEGGKMSEAALKQEREHLAYEWSLLVSGRDGKANDGLGCWLKRSRRIRQIGTIRGAG